MNGRCCGLMYLSRTLATAALVIISWRSRLWLFLLSLPVLRPVGGAGGRRRQKNAAADNDMCTLYCTDKVAARLCHVACSMMKNKIVWKLGRRFCDHLAKHFICFALEHNICNYHVIILSYNNTF